MDVHEVIARLEALKASGSELSMLLETAVCGVHQLDARGPGRPGPGCLRWAGGGGARADSARQSLDSIDPSTRSIELAPGHIGVCRLLAARACRFAK